MYLLHVYCRFAFEPFNIHVLNSSKLYNYYFVPFTRCPESVRMSKEASPKVLSSKLLGGVDQVC